MDFGQMLYEEMKDVVLSSEELGNNSILFLTPENCSYGSTFSWKDEMELQACVSAAASYLRSSKHGFQGYLLLYEIVSTPFDVDLEKMNDEEYGKLLDRDDVERMGVLIYKPSFSEYCSCSLFKRNHTSKRFDLVESMDNFKAKTSNVQLNLFLNLDNVKSDMPVTIAEEVLPLELIEGIHSSPKRAL